MPKMEYDYGKYHNDDLVMAMVQKKHPGMIVKYIDINLAVSPPVVTYRLALQPKPEPANPNTNPEPGI